MSCCSLTVFQAPKDLPKLAQEILATYGGRRVRIVLNWPSFHVHEYTSRLLVLSWKLLDICSYRQSGINLWLTIPGKRNKKKTFHFVLEPISCLVDAIELLVSRNQVAKALTSAASVEYPLPLKSAHRHSPVTNTEVQAAEETNEPRMVHDQRETPVRDTSNCLDGFGGLQKGSAPWSGQRTLDANIVYTHVLVQTDESIAVHCCKEEQVQYTSIDAARTAALEKARSTTRHDHHHLRVSPIPGDSVDCDVSDHDSMESEGSAPPSPLLQYVTRRVPAAHLV